MLVRHKEENEEWIQQRKKELDQERQDLEKERVRCYCINVQKLWTLTFSFCSGQITRRARAIKEGQDGK